MRNFYICAICQSAVSSTMSNRHKYQYGIIHKIINFNTVFVDKLEEIMDQDW